MKGGFLFTWLPFSVILMCSTFLNSEISPLFSTLSNMFASSSSIWSTLLYLISNKHIKAKLTFDLILCKNPTQTDYEIFNMNVCALYLPKKFVYFLNLFSESFCSIGNFQ